MKSFLTFKGEKLLPVSNNREFLPDPLQKPILTYWQTSIHSALTSSAILCGAMRTALLVAPAAGTTSSKFFSDTSQ